MHKKFPNVFFFSAIAIILIFAALFGLASQQVSKTTISIGPIITAGEDGVPTFPEVGQTVLLIAYIVNNDEKENLIDYTLKILDRIGSENSVWHETTMLNPQQQSMVTYTWSPTKTGKYTVEFSIKQQEKMVARKILQFEVIS
mgnify:CR=1 FL=1